MSSPQWRQDVCRHCGGLVVRFMVSLSEYDVRGNQDDGVCHFLISGVLGASGAEVIASGGVDALKADDIAAFAGGEVVIVILIGWVPEAAGGASFDDIEHSQEVLHGISLVSWVSSHPQWRCRLFRRH
jgi:hypothetical protein